MRTPLFHSSARPALTALAAVGMLVGCQKPAVTEAPVVAALTVVQGNDQSVQAGKELPHPVVLRVTDRSGVKMAGIPVTLVVAAGGGTVSPASGVTDAQGEYSAKWTVGPVADNQLLASISGLDPVRITALGIVPSDIIIAQGNSQTAIKGGALLTSIVVRVVGGGNVPMVGITVLFQVLSGGGAISPQSAVTSSLGEVTVKWTLGTVVGTQTAVVTASTLSPATLTATALP